LREWPLSPHVCRSCLTRVMVLDGVYRCAGCGNESTRVADICGCGLRGDGGRFLGFKCGPNPSRGPGNTQEYVILLSDGSLADVVKPGALT
jgi:hypothetical protein